MSQSRILSARRQGAQGAVAQLVQRALFLFIDAFYYHKVLHTLVEAARSANYPIVLIVVGPMETKLKTCIAELGLKIFIFLVPYWT